MMSQQQHGGRWFSRGQASNSRQRSPSPTARFVKQGEEVGDGSAPGWQYVQQVGLVADTRDA
jgi:hypothetical protein